MKANLKQENKLIPLTYHFNLNPEMIQHLISANQSPHVHFSNSFSFEVITDETTKNPLALRQDFSPATDDYVLQDFQLELPGYHFAGWKIVRDDHNLMPRLDSEAAVAIYAGERSIVHQTDRSEHCFLWQPGERIHLSGQRYDFYAQWIPIEYDIRLIPRTVFGLELHSPLPSGQRTISKDFQIKLNPTIEGYEFISWAFAHDQEKWNCPSENFVVPAGIGPVTLVALFDELS